LREAIERWERHDLAVLQHVVGARQPVVQFGFDEVGQHFERVPGVRSFVAAEPGLGQVAQPGVEQGGRAAEQGGAVGEVEGRHGRLGWCRA
jgi:hypothetical protein